MTSNPIGSGARARSVLAESLWSGRVLGAAVLAMIWRGLLFFLDKVWELPTGFAGYSTMGLLCVGLAVVPIYVPIEMRSANLVRIAVSPPVGELGRMPLAAQAAAWLALTLIAAPVILVQLVSSDPGSTLDSLTGAAWQAVLPAFLIWSVYRKIVGPRPGLL